MKKSELELMNDEDLLKFLFSSIAKSPKDKSNAFELLKVRGHEFSTDELHSIKLISKLETEGNLNRWHENYTKSSNILFLSIPLGFFEIIFLPKFIHSSFYMIQMLGMALLITTVALLLRFGDDWVKYLLAAIVVLDFLKIIAAIYLNEFSITLIVTEVSLITTLALHILALYMVWKIPKNSSSFELV